MASLFIGVAALRLMGRVWWCEQRDPRWFVGDTQSAHSSQHLVDWYSLSHLLHGVFFFWVLGWLTRFRPGAVKWTFALAVVIETAWEVLENSPMVIERYRQTAAVGYSGDSIVNSIGDLLFCIAGFLLARAVGWKVSVGVFIASELVMLFFVRDNLTLNVLMLLWPIDAIRQWQMGG